MRALIALALWSATAAAEPSGDTSGVSLSWVRAQSAASCVDASVVQSDVERRLGWSPFDEPRARSIEVSVFRQGDEWRADIQVRAPDGRSLGSRAVKSRAPDCDSLAAAAGLAIALLIDPDALVRESPSAPAAADPALPPPQPSAEQALAPASATPALAVPDAHAVRGSFAAGALAGLRLLPNAAPGLALIGELSDLGIEGLSMQVGAHFLPEQRATTAGVTASFGVTFAEVGPCYELVSARAVSLAVCLSLWVGAMHAAIFERQPVDVGQRWWWATAGGLSAQWSLAGPFVLRTAIAAAIPLTRRDNVVQVLGPGIAEERVVIFEEPRVGVLGFVGPGVRF